MKVLLIDACYAEGSTGEIAYKITRGLIDEGHESELLYAIGQASRQPYGMKFTYTSEVYIHALLSRLTGWFCRYAPLSTRKLLKEIELFKPDIIHIHDPKPYYMNLCALLKYIADKKIKLVLTLHSEFFYTGKCGYAYDCIKYSTVCKECPQLKEYPKTLIFDKTKKMFLKKKRDFQSVEELTVVCPSEWLAEKARNSFFSSRDIRVIHNGVDEMVFRRYEGNAFREKYGLTDKKVILMVASNALSERKGGMWVLRLAERMRNFMFVLVGTDKAAQFDNVIELPLVRNREELARIYSESDLFLLCSKKETFSMTCAEALCCGTPIIGFEAGAPETIFKKPYAEFVEYGNLDMLEDRINAFFKTDYKMKKNQCEQYGKSEFTQGEMTKRYLDLYTEIMKSN
jgi:glycosyltransferase involved in cell wall biosynthesis